MTFQVPPHIDLVPLDPIQGFDDDLDETQWQLYRDVNDPHPALPGLLATTNREKSKLVEIITATATMYTQHGPRLNAQQVLQMYKRFVSWRDELPSGIADVGSNSQALPHVLSLQ
jgi:hypothetical protein